MGQIELVPLHFHPEYLVECEALLNSEWPQNVIARRRMLTNSRDELPCSLVLVENGADPEDGFTVIGHGRIGHVLGVKKAFWIKSVVVRKDYRGRGFGKLLMSKIEDYAIHRGYGCSYLTTYDRQGFYRGIGYECCQPVCFIGHAFLSEKLMVLGRGDESNAFRCSDVQKSDVGSNSLKVHPTPPPPPPPLPSPTHLPTGQGKHCPGNSNEKTWMRKLLFA